jgi:ABC-type uncharacterized transport system fused permease/ATPase subunit
MEEDILQALRDVQLHELVGEAQQLPSEGSTTPPASDSVEARSRASDDSADVPVGQALLAAAAEAGAFKAASTKPWQPPESAFGEGLDQVDSWGQRLSPGQQQRLAIGHALLRKPRLLFLDEATSNVSKAAAIELYETVVNQLPDITVVSISHDVATLEPLHDMHITIKGDGTDTEKELVMLKGSEAAKGRGR